MRSCRDEGSFLSKFWWGDDAGGIFRLPGEAAMPNLNQSAGNEPGLVEWRDGDAAEDLHVACTQPVSSLPQLWRRAVDSGPGQPATVATEAMQETLRIRVKLMERPSGVAVMG